MWQMTEILQMKDLEKEMDSVFESEEEYERFREEFSAEMEPILDEQKKLGQRVKKTCGRRSFSKHQITEGL